MCTFLLAGCASWQPHHDGDDGGAGRSSILAPPPAYVARLGVEYLPPEVAMTTSAHLDRFGAFATPGAPLAGGETHSLLLSPPIHAIGHAPIARASARLALPRAAQGGEPAPIAVTRISVERFEQLTARREPYWRLRREELAAVDDPFERMSLRLVHELVGEDGRRLGNEMGARYLTQMAMRRADFLTPSTWTEQEQENQDWMFQRYGARLLRRPVVRSLREATVISNLELALEGFKADNLPLSQPYQEAHPHGSGSSLGHFAVRLRARGGDPVEITWVRSGWRIGGSRERFKASYGTDLAEDVRLTLQSDYSYRERLIQVSASLECKLNPLTRAYVLTGNRMNALFGPPAFLEQGSLFDLAPGIAFFVEHLF